MNLIATCSRHLEEEACDEISDIIEELGDDSPRIGKSYHTIFQKTKKTTILYQNFSKILNNLHSCKNKINLKIFEQLLLIFSLNE